MALNFGDSKLSAGGFQTPAGTVLITGTKVYAARITTSAGTYIFSTTTPTKLSPYNLTGFKAQVQFHTAAFATNQTTYISPGCGTVNMGTGISKKAYIPWAGSVLGIGGRSSAKLTAGHVTFTAYNGTTKLTGMAVTLNTTDFKVVNGALGTGATTYPFTANNLKMQIITSADYAPASTSFLVQAWVEI